MNTETYNSELRSATQDVKESRLELENALTHLETKISKSIDRVNVTASRIKAPYIFAQQNPFSAVAVCLLAGFVVGAGIPFSSLRRRSDHAGGPVLAEGSILGAAD